MDDNRQQMIAQIKALVMKANDLMIGDWVLCDKNAQSDYEFDNVNYQPCQIQNGEDIDYANERNMIGDADVYQPIPLTAEMLEKNGFERSGVFVEWKYESDDVYMIYKPFPYLKIQTEECIVAFPCQYVHELQHALRLCGIEKEVVL